MNKIVNSLLVKSGILKVNIFEYAPPKAILWYIYIVYAAEKIIEELAKTPNKDDLSNTHIMIKILLWNLKIKELHS